jgi:DNA gyrase subunit A
MQQLDLLTGDQEPEAQGGGRRPPGSGGPPARPPRSGGNVEDVPLHALARKRYLDYAMSVITSRALPDVRDGLKPVQRRILFAAHNDLRLHPDSKPRKSAAIVGEVMSKYHPHGDQAIYDALARMAQPFSLRYPLIDGHGNFGSIDGDPPAAMRYTEARLSPSAPPLLEEYRQQTVAKRPTYDALREEPVVLPARYPNLLANGGTGIAVGMATNIPPHNLKELCRACIALIDNDNWGTRGLMRWVKGPDFPGGGEILNSHDELVAIYERGHGSISVRGTWKLEKGRGPRRVVIESIPYNVNKAKLVGAIGDAVAARRLPMVVDVRDESTDDIRIVLELKRGSDPDAVVAWLHKHTELQSNFAMNLTCLVPTENPQVAGPQRLELRLALQHFLDFRFDVVTRRLRFQLARLLERIHILEGFEIVFNALDEAIALIRASSNKPDARERLMDRFGLDHDQAEAVLEVKLYKLAQLEIEAILTELAEKRAEAARIEALLADPEARWGIVKEELAEVSEEHGDDRRTQVVGPQDELEYDEQAYIEAEDCWVIVTRDGWLKRQRSFTDVGAIRTRDGDQIGWLLRANTRSTVVFFGSSGRAYTLRVDDVVSTTGYGEPLQRRFAMADGERVVGAAAFDKRSLPKVPQSVREAQEADAPPPPWGLAGSRGGKVLRFSLSNFEEPSKRTGRVYARLDKRIQGDAILAVEGVGGSDDEVVAMATERGRAILFPVELVPVLSGPGKGVTGIKLSDQDLVLGWCVSRAARQGLSVESSLGGTTVVRPTKFRLTNRGGKGQVVLRRGRFTRVHWPIPKDDGNAERS